MNYDTLLLENFVKYHTTEAAALTESLQDSEVEKGFNILPTKVLPALLSQMDRYKVLKGIETLDESKLTALFESFPISVARILLSQMDEQKRNLILENISKEKARSIRVVLRYSENAVGAYMDSRPFFLTDDSSVGEAIEKVKESSRDTFQHLPIIGRHQKLVGVVDVKSLLVSDKEKSLHSIMMDAPFKILAEMDMEVLLEPGVWDDAFVSLPVVDAGGIFLGVLQRKTVTSFEPFKKVLSKEVAAASSALGDLYRIGFLSIVRGADEIRSRNAK